MRKVSTLALIAFLALMATSCDLSDLDLSKSDQDSGGSDSRKPDSGPSALGVAERQAAYEALLAEFNEYWLTERDEADPFAHGFVVPAACKERMAQAQDREKVLANAQFIAVAEDIDLKEIYDLWGKRIDLLQELDRDMKQGCR